MTITVKKVSLERTPADQIFLPAILQGLLTTARHFFRNTLTPGMGDVDTIRYGEPDVDVKSYSARGSSPSGGRPRSSSWRGRSARTM
jgi:hypothetical protein